MIIVSNLPYSFSEGDVLTVFEQYGTVCKIHLNKGVCIMEYEEENSDLLAVENFDGITLLGRKISVEPTTRTLTEYVDPRKLTPAVLQEPTFKYDTGTESETE